MKMIYQYSKDECEIIGSAISSIPENIQFVTIDETNLYKLSEIEKIPKVEYCFNVKALDHFIIPRHGDVLFSIQVTSLDCKSKIFMYDWTGSCKVVYDELSGTGLLEPFDIDGIPLIGIGKNIYVSLSNASEIKIKYGYLDTASRRLLGTNRDTRLQHKNGDMYQIIGADHFGHSPNYIELIK